jgi:NADP-dependent 3-hydroxy acid dehydrogenase YdfG
VTAHRPGPPTAETLFVVSGGGRGIAARCAIGLAARFGCRLALLGRTPLGGEEPAWAAPHAGGDALRRAALAELGRAGARATPAAAERLVRAVLARREVEETLAEIARRGGRADYLAVDVAEAEALRSALAPLLAEAGEVGLLHAAGVLADGPIGRKRAADFDRVFGPKLDGLANLLEAVGVERLRHLVLFSSASGVFGNPGQAEYAMANAALDQWALRIAREHPACRVVAFAWGPWDGGMVTPDLRRLFEERGIPLIPLQAGACILADELGNGRGEPRLVVGAAPAPPAPTAEPRPRRVVRELSLDDNPFLRDHVVNGRAVLPVVASANWLIDACEALHPGHAVTVVRDYRVYKGIVFEPADLGEFVLEVAPADGEDGAVTMDARISSLGGERPVPHYGASLTLARRRAPAPRLPVDLAPEGPIEGRELYADGTLFHGPRLRGIRRVLWLREDGLATECHVPAVPAPEQGRFRAGRFNHFAADVAFQAMLVWARLATGCASLPLRCERCEIFRPLPFGATFYTTCLIRHRTDERVVADVALHDADGLAHLRLEGAEVTISPALNAMFGVEALW